VTRRGTARPLRNARAVISGLGGATVMVSALLTPFLRDRRSRWGVDDPTARATLPGDELVSNPRWQWTHGIGIDAAPSDVWPWVAQIGADRAGFYSYELLENLVGCKVRNADRVHPEWAVREGDVLRLHPNIGFPVERLDAGHFFVAHLGPDAAPGDASEKWVNASWLFLVEPHHDGARFISRYRVATSDDLATRLQFGPALIEPIGFAMDRAMLRGVKRRVEGDATS
jgi:hypothetical protein